MDVFAEKPAVAPHYFHGTPNPAIIKKRGQYSYIEAPHMLDMMNKMYRHRWSFDIIDQRRDELGNFDILFTVVGRITVPGIGQRTMAASSSFVKHCVKREGKVELTKTGNLKEISGQNIIWENTENLWKNATTDCMKKCSSWFRVAEAVYGLDEYPSFSNKEETLLTDKQKESLARIRDMVGGNSQLKAWLWKWDPTIRQVKDLDSSIADEFMSWVGCYFEKEEFITGMNVVEGEPVNVK